MIISFKIMLLKTCKTSLCIISILSNYVEIKCTQWAYSMDMDHYFKLLVNAKQILVIMKHLCLQILADILHRNKSCNK